LGFGRERERLSEGGVGGEVGSRGIASKETGEIQLKNWKHNCCNQHFFSLA
jgi:hypothetical protein